VTVMEPHSILVCSWHTFAALWISMMQEILAVMIPAIFLAYMPTGEALKRERDPRSPYRTIEPQSEF
jgi:hypothetical protein